VEQSVSRPDKAFTKDVDRFTVRHRRATARDWRSYLRAAWRASVGVAMRLGDRFHHNPMVREALRVSCRAACRSSSSTATR
jgi:hypothetical protein